jgi:hypothetical protein
MKVFNKASSWKGRADFSPDMQPADTFLDLYSPALEILLPTST